MKTKTIDWSCKYTWKKSATNTAWCLLGCSIGDLGTILFFQITKIPFPVLAIMTLAIINGLVTSIILETFILIKQKIDFNKMWVSRLYFTIRVIYVILAILIVLMIVYKLVNKYQPNLISNNI